MQPSSRPDFRDLDRAECDALLAQNFVGRIAYAFHDRVDIEPIHYAYDGAWLYARTSPGSKLVTISHNRWVAFEVDEVDGVFDWRSVVVHGTVYPITSDGPPVDARRYERAVSLLREIVPGTLTADDPVADRDLVFGIHVAEVRGRSARRAAR